MEPQVDHRRDTPSPPNGLRVSSAEGVRCMRRVLPLRRFAISCDTAERPLTAPNRWKGDLRERRLSVSDKR